MDDDYDYFGASGRTDDHLFSDEIVPLDPPAHQESVASSSIDNPVALPAPTAPPAATPVATALQPQQQQRPQIPKSLAQSRHNRPDKPPRSSNSKGNDNNKDKAAKPAPSSQHESKPAPSAPPSAPKAPAAASKYAGSNTASAFSEARLGSGVNPRTKLTEEELAAKMENMRLVNAEKTRNFEKAQRDASDYEKALAQSQAEARKKREEDARRRLADAEGSRRMNDERNKNRERKLNAMSQKDGGWDEGKEDRMLEEDRRGFRSAYGGIRGLRSGGDPDDRHAGTGKRRGGRGRQEGRGGGSQNNHRSAAGGPVRGESSKTGKEEFPPLPPTDKPSGKAGSAATPELPPLVSWDDDVIAASTGSKDP